MTGLSNNFGDQPRAMIATGMPGCMPQRDHETVAAVPASATGQYLRPILERATVKPKVVEVAPKRPKRSRRVEPEEPDLIAAK
jgi:hypothetical protein